MPELSKNDLVNIQPMIIGEKKWKKGRVLAKLENRRYLVRTEDGGELERNRKHLRKQTKKEGVGVPREMQAEKTTAKEKHMET